VVSDRHWRTQSVIGQLKLEIKVSLQNTFSKLSDRSQYLQPAIIRDGGCLAVMPLDPENQHDRLRHRRIWQSRDQSSPGLGSRLLHHNLEPPLWLKSCCQVVVSVRKARELWSKD
jgi:hypothetical protein